MPERQKQGAHKGRWPAVVTICLACEGYLEYGTLGDYSARGPRTPGQVKADHRHGYRMYRTLGVSLDHVSPGCGRGCPDHGVAAYDGDEDAYEAALDTREVEPWFSSSPCESCGAIAGNRTHATMWIR